jgi:hypothetical protein
VGQAHREAGPCDIFLFFFDNGRLDIPWAVGGKLSGLAGLATFDGIGPVLRCRFGRGDDGNFSLLPLYHSGGLISTQSKTSFDFDCDLFASGLVEEATRADDEEGEKSMEGC